MAAIGRPRKYQSAKALREAVDGYWAAISYEVPAVVSTATGEVDGEGRVLYKSKLLTERLDGGKPKTVVKYLEPPSVPGLLLYLGISKSTWSAYRADERLGGVVAYWDARYEAYLVDRLETGKHIAGVMFNLSYNFGWKEKREISLDRETRKAVTASGMTLEEKRALLEAAARDFGEARSDREQGTKAGTEQTDRRRDSAGGWLAELEDLGPVAEGAERDKAGDGERIAAPACGLVRNDVRGETGDHD